MERVSRDLQALSGQVLPVQQKPTVLVREGNPEEEILSAIHSHHIDLAVMGTRGISGIKRFFLGSVSEWIVQEGPCPVLVARGSDRLVERGVRILMATDGSLEAQGAVEFLN